MNLSVPLSIYGLTTPEVLILLLGLWAKNVYLTLGFAESILGKLILHSLETLKPQFLPLTSWQNLVEQPRAAYIIGLSKPYSRQILASIIQLPSFLLILLDENDGQEARAVLGEMKGFSPEVVAPQTGILALQWALNVLNNLKEREKYQLMIPIGREQLKESGMISIGIAIFSVDT
jgi:hypothetical protein